MLLKNFAITLLYAVMCMTWIIAVDSKKIEGNPMSVQMIEVPSCKFSDAKFTDYVIKENRIKG